MSGRTPGPWADISSDSASLVSTGCKWVGCLAIDCTHSGATYSEDRANAAFIVTACNAYDKLVAALCKFLEAGVGNSTNFELQAEARKMARAALANNHARQEGAIAEAQRIDRIKEAGPELVAALLDQITTGEDLRDALRTKILATQYDEIVDHADACMHSRDRARAALVKAGVL